LPDALERWKKRDGKKDTDRTAKHFVVPVGEIREKGYDLSINQYMEAVHSVVPHDAPKDIIARLRKLETEIGRRSISELEGML
jgi:type I restriction enzyme M protein